MVEKNTFIVHAGLTSNGYLIRNAMSDKHSHPGKHEEKDGCSHQCDVLLVHIKKGACHAPFFASATADIAATALVLRIAAFHQAVDAHPKKGEYND